MVATLVVEEGVEMGMLGEEVEVADVLEVMEVEKKARVGLEEENLEAMVENLQEWEVTELSLIQIS